MIDIGSGDLFLDSISAEEANFDVSSGEVEITNYTGPVHADVSSGDLKIQVNELKHDIEVELSSGFVSLDLPENADFTLDGKMMSGKFLTTSS